MAAIYVLHFDRPLAHAQHYIGCTDNIRARLEAHARGAGSRLCKELRKQGIGWTLGAIFKCSHRRMRQLERSLKDQKNASRYCEICSSLQATFQGTTPISIENLHFPTRSDKLQPCSFPDTGQTVRVTTPDEPSSTMAAILEMMKRDKDALGFVPAGGSQGLELLVPRGLIAVAEAGGEIVGYASHTLNPSRTRVTIHQCCVRDDARLFGLGSKMVDLIDRRYEVDEVVAKVRDDLAANHFWSAIGFNIAQTVRHPTSRSLINHYTLKRNGDSPLWQATPTTTAEHTKSTTKENESPLQISSPESSEKPGQ